MDARSNSSVNCYVTEGMLSHLRQRIRGSKKAIAIACSRADVSGGFRGLDQAYGRQARIGKAELSAKNSRRIFRGHGATGTLKAEKARRGEFRQQIFCAIRSNGMHAAAGAKRLRGAKKMGVGLVEKAQRIGEKDARLLLLGQRVRAASNIVDGPLVGDGQRKRRLCLLYTSPSPRDKRQSRMPSSA